MDRKKKVTIKEIAENTGVSVGTVHRVIYGKAGVGEETRRKILEEIKRTHYQINSAAASIKRKTLVIAVVLPKCEGDERFYFRGLWKGIQDAAEELAPYNIEFRYVESAYGLGNISLELQNLFDTILDDINGIITIADDEETAAWVRRFRKQGVTVVSVSSYSDESDCLCSIRADYEVAGRLAAEYLDSVCGEREGKLMVLTGNKEIYSNEKYAGGFVQFEGTRGRESDMILVDGFGMDEIGAKVRELLKKEHITGIFSCTARNTYSICRILDEMNKHDICCVGTDVFLELEPYFSSGILNASIYQSNVEQGRTAVDVLYRYLTLAELDRKKIYLPVGIVMRSNYQYYIS